MTTLGVPITGDLMWEHVGTDRGAIDVVREAPPRLELELKKLLSLALSGDCTLEFTVSTRLFPVTYRLVAYMPNTYDVTLDRADV